MAKANVDMVFDADDAGVLRKMAAMEKRQDVAEAKMRKLRSTAGRTKRSVEGIGDAGDRSFGSAAQAKITSYVAGLASVSAAIAAITQAFREDQRARDEAGERIKTAAEGRAKLLQVSDTDEETFTRLTQRVEQLRTSFGMAAVDAYRLIFALKSGGDTFVQQADLFASMAEVGLPGEVAAEAVVKMQAAWRESQAGSRQILNEILTAAANAPVVAEEIAAAMSVTSGLFAGVGGQREQLEAFAGVMAEIERTPLTTTMKIKSLSGQLKKKLATISFEGMEPLAGLDLIMALPQLASEGRLMQKRVGEEGNVAMALEDWLGEVNAIQAAEFAKINERKIRERMGEIRAAGAAPAGEDVIGKALDIFARDVQLQSDKAARIAEQKRMVDEEGRFGSASRMATAVKEDLTKQRRARGLSSVGLAIEGAKDYLKRLFMEDEWFIKNATEQQLAGTGLLPYTVPPVPALSPETRGMIRKRIENLRSAATSPMATRENVMAYFRATNMPGMAERLEAFKPSAPFRSDRDIVREFLRSEQYRIQNRGESLWTSEARPGIAGTFGEARGIFDRSVMQPRPMTDEETRRLDTTTFLLDKLGNAADGLDRASRHLGNSPRQKAMGAPDRDL